MTVPGRPWGITPEAKRIIGQFVGKQMSEAGGKKLAEDLRVRLPDLRKLADDLRVRAAGAVTAFTTEAHNVEKAIRSLEDEADAMRQVANDMLGNNPPGEDHAG